MSDKTFLKDLIDKVTADDLPTNEFTIEDTDPYVLLGKINEVIANLTAIRDLVDASDKTSLEALNKAIVALTNSQKALQDSLTALKTANTAIDTANSSIETANNAKTESAQALLNSQNALNKVNEAVTNANKAIADSGEALTKANTAITDSSEALTKANTAITDSASALSKANTAITNSGSALSKAEDAFNTAKSAESYAINADANSSSAIDIANEALEKVVAGTGTTIYDYNGQKLKDAKFSGSNSINVDMASDDPSKFEFRVDDNILTDITNTKEKATTNESNIITINDNIKNIWNVIYPIGSVYITLDKTNPSTLFGGTWHRVIGKFLRGAKDENELGYSGGEDKHTLTIDEMPSHTHTQEAHRHGLQSANNYSGSTDGMGRGDRRQIGCMQNNNGGTQYYTTPQNVSNRPYYMTAEQPKISSTGKGFAFNILPTYLNVYIWYRLS